MDDSTLVTRKDAENRDKQYDLRILVNHQISERYCTPGFSFRVYLCSVSYRFPYFTDNLGQSSNGKVLRASLKNVSCLIDHSDKMISHTVT